MAEIVGQCLEVICVEVGIIPEDVVVAGSGGSLDSLVGHQVEVTLRRMVNALVNHGAGKSIAVLVLVIVGGKESRKIHRVVKINEEKPPIFFTLCDVASGPQ